jgi:4-amino-4-deoxy-L-arabinose transferase-like glycosyltransferase
MSAHRWVKLRDYVLPALMVIVLFIGMVYYRPGEIPSLWFDEGWSLTVARNWIETGQYARLLEGDPVSAEGMAKPFSTTAPIALSFYLFGVGSWQGRLPAMLFMALSFYITFQIVRHLYGYKVGYLTIFALIFIAAPPVHPLIVGRQAIAEAPLILYLVAGYTAFWHMLNGNKIATLGVVLFWGLALDAKGHTLPFLSLSLIIPIGLAFLRKHWRIIHMFGIVWLGSLLVYFLVNGIETLLTRGFPIYDAPMQGLYSVTAFVLNPHIRLSALFFLVISGLPTILGIVYGAVNCWRKCLRESRPTIGTYLKLSLISLVVSWALWFFLLSISWGRYFFPVSYFGCIFIALLFKDSFAKVKQMLAYNLFQQLRGRLPLYVTILVATYGGVMNFTFLHHQINLGNNDAFKVAEYVNKHISTDELVETYESELLFMIDNPVHFPPDQTQVELNRRLFLKQEIDISYNPERVQFRYLIDGPSSVLWQLYTPILEQEQFKSLFVTGGYTIYERVDYEENYR